MDIAHNVEFVFISGRITRARRNMDTVKKILSNTSRHREHNTFRRIQTVVDSDSE